MKVDCPIAVVSPHWLPSRERTCAQIADMTPKILSFESLEDHNHGQQVLVTSQS